LSLLLDDIGFEIIRVVLLGQKILRSKLILDDPHSGSCFVLLEYMYKSSTVYMFEKHNERESYSPSTVNITVSDSNCEREESIEPQ
jgi:hypothetical protein